MSGDRPFLIIPPTLAQVRIPRSVVDETRRLLAPPGEAGCEAVALWLGRVISATTGQVDAVYFPRQVAYRLDAGLAVEIPIDEWTQLVFRLPPGTFILAKLHTHAGAAYHSEVDADNPFLCHEGAISITIPDFARAAIGQFEHCSVNVLRGHRWRELTPEEVRQTLLVEEDCP